MAFLKQSTEGARDSTPCLHTPTLLLLELLMSVTCDDQPCRLNEVSSILNVSGESLALNKTITKLAAYSSRYPNVVHTAG